MDGPDGRNAVKAETTGTLKKRQVLRPASQQIPTEKCLQAKYIKEGTEENGARGFIVFCSTTRVSDDGFFTAPTSPDTMLGDVEAADA